MTGVTHEDLLVVLYVLGALAVAAVIFAGWVSYVLYRGLRDGQRMVRAVAGLVYQEEEKTREILRDLREPR
jgi:hypothetical protein